MIIIPAILTKDENTLKQELLALEQNLLIKWSQIDIMDNAFVPYSSISLGFFKNISTRLFLEAHLMVIKPDDYLNLCYEGGFKRVIFHIESQVESLEFIKRVKLLGLEVGVALNPETPCSKIEPLIPYVDLVLFLGVHPGQQGQTFVKDVLTKIKEFRKSYPHVLISVDGGVHLDNVHDFNQSGVNMVIMGSALWKNNELNSNLIKAYNSL